MKVAQVIAGCNHESSGTSYFIMNMCRALTQCGADTTLHSFDAQVRERDDFQVVDYQRASGLLSWIGWCPDMLRGLKKAVQNVDILHTNGVWLMPNVYPAWVKNDRVKLVLSPHGMLSPWALGHSKWKKCVFGWLWQNSALRKVDMFHATSEKEYREIRALGYKQPILIAPLGINIPATPIAGTHAHKVVFLGRLHKVKGVDRLLEAWCKIISTIPSDWQLEIAGPDGGARAELENYVAQNHIANVRFVGELHGAEKYAFLASASIYVLPSHTENFAITIPESLICGTPVIASKGSPWRGVEEHHCGRWVDNSSDSLAAALVELISLNDAERASMGASGRSWMAQDFSWDRIGCNVMAAYEWLLGDGEMPVCVKMG